MKKLNAAIILIILIFSVGMSVACSDALSAPKNITVEEFVLRFDKVKNADRYLIKITGDNFKRQFTTVDIENDIAPMPKGSFQIAVTAYDAEHDAYSPTTLETIQVSEIQSRKSLAEKVDITDYNSVSVKWKADILEGYTLIDSFLFEDMMYYIIKSADGIKTLCNIDGKSISSGYSFDFSHMKNNIIKVDSDKYFTLDGRLRYTAAKNESVTVVGYDCILISTFDEINGMVNTVLNVVSKGTSIVQSKLVKVINNYVVDRRVDSAGGKLRLHVFPFGGNGETDIGVFSDEISVLAGVDLHIAGDKLLYVSSMSGTELTDYNYVLGEGNSALKVKSYVGSVDIVNGSKRALNHSISLNSNIEVSKNYIMVSIVNPNENKFVDTTVLQSFGYALYDFDLNEIMTLNYSRPFYYRRTDDYSMGVQYMLSDKLNKFDQIEIIGDTDCNFVYSISSDNALSFERVNKAKIAFEYRRGKDAAVFDVRDVKTNKLLDGMTIKATDKVFTGYNGALKVDADNVASILTYDVRIAETPVKDYHFALNPYVYVYLDKGAFGLKSVNGEVITRASENMPEKYMIAAKDDGKIFIVYNDSIYVITIS